MSPQIDDINREIEVLYFLRNQIEIIDLKSTAIVKNSLGKLNLFE